MFVNKTSKHLSKSYKDYVTGKLIYFWKQDDLYLRNAFVP